MIWITPELSARFPPHQHRFIRLMRLRGETFREHKNRRTQRIRLQNQFYFLKQHHPVGWWEILRSLLKGRLPILSAQREWQAIKQLQALNIAVPEVCGVGTQGWIPAYKQSFLLTRELPPHVTLETLALSQHLPLRFKWQLINAVGKIAGTLHRAGINHRDFYLCHLLLDKQSLFETNCTDPLIYVIDLHRAGLRHKTPLRWILKDLAGLDFSSRTAQLTRGDRVRFIRAYESAAGCNRHPTFWKKVEKRGNKLTRKHSP